KSVKRFKKNKPAVVAGYFIIFMMFVALTATWIAPYQFDAQDVSKLHSPPNAENWLGTDSLGRDMLSRVIYGARVSMAVGIDTAVVSLLMGLVYGAISGWFGGRIDSIMMRFIDILYAIPALVLLILVKVMVDSLEGFENPEVRAYFSIFSALSIYGWMSIARIVRGQI